MPVPSPQRLNTDDFTGDWKKDQEDVFRLLNKSNQNLSDAVNNNILFTGLGAQKIVLKSVTIPSPWIVPKLNSGWTVFDPVKFPVRYMKTGDGTVFVEGLATHSGAAPGAAFPLGPGYMPQYDQNTITIISTAGTTNFGRLNFRAVGDVGIYFGTPSTWASLCGSFLSANLNPAIIAPFPIQVKSALTTGTASMVLPGVATDINTGGGAIPPTGNFSVSWTNATGISGNGTPANFININNISGLIPGRTYQVTLWAFPSQ